MSTKRDVLVVALCLATASALAFQTAPGTDCKGTGACTCAFLRGHASLQTAGRLRIGRDTFPEKLNFFAIAQINTFRSAVIAPT